MINYFTVGVYNILQPVPEIIRRYGQRERSERIKDVVHNLDTQFNLDVLVCNEVINSFSKEALGRDMPTLGFVYRTKPLTDTFAVDGGTVVFSKYPIVQEANMIFADDCHGSDCCASKGLAFARIHKDGVFYNVIGTHLQAWPSTASHVVRMRQADQAAKFIAALNIPQDEPLIFAGDLNSDMYHDRENLRHLMYVLKMDLPALHPDSHPFTVDPQTNALVGNDDPAEYHTDEYPNGCADEYYKTLSCPCCPAQMIDYVFYSSAHLKPTESWMRVVKAKVEPFQCQMNIGLTATITDISDHYPVIGYFKFEHPARSTAAKALLAISPIPQNTNTTNTTVVSIVICVLGILFLALSWWGVRRWNKNAPKTRLPPVPTVTYI